MNTFSRTPALFLALLLSLSAFPAAAHDYEFGDIFIVHPWARATPDGAKVGAGYATIHNKGDEADRLVAISSEISEKSEIHEMAVDAKGIMTITVEIEFMVQEMGAQPAGEHKAGGHGG
jgi:periplasmic copper chaperone A